MNQISAVIQRASYPVFTNSTDIILSHDEVRWNRNSVVCMVTRLRLAGWPRVRIPLGVRYFSILQIVQPDSEGLPTPLFSRYWGKATEA